MTQPGVSRVDSFFFARQYLAGFPAPRFYADTTPFSTKRVLNALALLRQLM
jgi:hypothetical protein